MRCVLNLNTVTLWAMWYTKYGPDTMQGWKGCDQLQTNQTITLTDARDNNQYTVAKLKDGKCWMTQNLRLQNYTLKPEDSDVLNNFVIPHSTNKWNMQEYDESRVYYYDSRYGAYYNWFTSTAGEGAKSLLGTSASVTSSICPRGWNLPTYNDATNLVGQYPGITAEQSPSNFIRSGKFSGTDLVSCDTKSICSNYSSERQGVWTTSSSGAGANNQYQFSLQYYNGSEHGFYVASWIGANGGTSVRCCQT